MDDVHGNDTKGTEKFGNTMLRMQMDHNDNDNYKNGKSMDTAIMKSKDTCSAGKLSHLELCSQK